MSAVAAPTKRYKCPYCGAPRYDIKNHIVMEHGISYWRLVVSIGRGMSDNIAAIVPNRRHSTGGTKSP